MKNPKSILVTGGSSGIGEALCLSYSAPGITISLTGRNPDRLEKTAQACRDKGAQVISRVLDVTDYDGMKSFIDEIDRISPLDLVIANAGIATNTALPLHDRTREVFDTNVYGVFNTIHPALELMRERKRGQIAIVSSIAGFISLSNSPSYSASKGAIKMYGKALRNQYARDGIEISVICPGWVLTPMTEENKDRIPFFVPMENTVKIIRRGLEHNRGLIAFPPSFAFFIWWLSTLPDSLQDFLLGKLVSEKKNK